MTKRKGRSFQGWMKRLEAHLDLEPLMRGCCQVLLEFSGADRCSIMVLDSDTDQLVVRWAQGSRVKLRRGAPLKFRMGEGLCGWVAQSRRAYCTQDADREPRFLPNQGGSKKFRPIKAICCLPLVANGRTVGVVNLTRFSSGRPFDRIRAGAARHFLDRLARVISQTTLLREAEAIAQRWRRQAKATSETVAQVSHEVRTPLALITEGAQQLLDNLGGELSGEQRKRVQIIRSQSDRMLRLVTELLDLSRIEAGRLVLHRKPADLGQVVRETVERYQPLVAPRELKLELESVPPVYGDPTRLTQIVENLLTNAVKFTAPQGSITVQIAARGRTAELAVSDTGVGIHPREQRRLFEKFSQLKVPASLGARGTGLGLAIVKEVVQLHGGTVRVSSQQGKGAAFFVGLPLYSPALALTDEFRLMREQAAREGRALAFQLLRLGGEDPARLKRLMGLLMKHVSREDRVLENPSGGIVILSVLDPQGFPAMRRRMESVFKDHPDEAPLSKLSWGWALIPQEETALPAVQELAARRAREGRTQEVSVP